MQKPKWSSGNLSLDNWTRACVRAASAIDPLSGMNQRGQNSHWAVVCSVRLNEMMTKETPNHVHVVLPTNDWLAILFSSTLFLLKHTSIAFSVHIACAMTIYVCACVVYSLKGKHQLMSMCISSACLSLVYIITVVCLNILVVATFFDFEWRIQFFVCIKKGGTGNIIYDSYCGAFPDLW